MIKRTQADAWFSKCVRMRTNWTCEYCGIELENNKADLHCSHFVTRGKNSTRYHPLNAFAHCKTCHKILGGDRWGGGNVAEFAHHYDDKYGAENREVIRVLSQTPFPKHKHHIDLMSAHYRAEYKRMDIERSGGYTGRLDFDLYSGQPALIALERDIRGRLD